MTKGKIEAALKEKITNLFRDNVGKGPERVTIRIVKNFIICETFGIITPLEKQLLKMDDGEEQVEKIMNNLFLISRDKYYDIIEKTIGGKIQDFITKVSVKNNTSYCLVVFAENIEKRIENAG